MGVIGPEQGATLPGMTVVCHRAEGMRKALAYMGLEADMRIDEIRLDKVFIGSCTNSRIEDLLAAAEVARGRRLADNIKLAMVVPGSGLIKQQAEHEGLDRIFIDAGFEWREPGCSMCLAMNAATAVTGHFADIRILAHSVAQ